MVGLLTLDSKIYNYGGFLQEMALQDIIRELGYECEVIDYDVSQELNTFSLRRGINNLSVQKIKNKVMKKKSETLSPSASDSILKRKRAFDSYREKKLVISRKYNYCDLHSVDLSYDQLVCGSDQIWNPDYNIPAFFLNFGKKECRRIIYAASIGKGYLTRHENKIYSNLLKYPDYISVREDSAQRIISQITEKKVEVVLDPTMIHQQEYWLEKAKDSSLRQNDYIFCYFLDLNDEKVKAANFYASKYNLKIITIPYLHNEMEKYSESLNGILLSAVNPADFLNLICNAEVVLTDSFHAAVFSIIFQKDFWCFGRDAGDYSMNTRLHTLLEYVDLRDRLIGPDELDNKSHCKQLDFSMDNLKYKQNQSIAFLKNALGTI